MPFITAWIVLIFTLAAGMGEAAYFATKQGEIMSLFKDLEEVAGAVVAVEALKKVDPDAGILTEGAAAVAGFEGTEAVINHFEKKDGE
jgi:hypothetical protein